MGRRRQVTNTSHLRLTPDILFILQGGNILKICFLLLMFMTIKQNILEHPMIKLH